MIYKLSVCVLILITFLAKSAVGQSFLELADSLPRSVDIGYDFRIQTFYMEKKNRGKGKRLSFYGEYRDSVMIKVNEKIIFIGQFDTTRKIPYDHTQIDLYINLSKRQRRSFNIVTVRLVKTGEYIEFPIDPRYYYMHVYLRETKGEFHYWNVNYDNNAPGE